MLFHIATSIIFKIISYLHNTFNAYNAFNLHLWKSELTKNHLKDE